MLRTSKTNAYAVSLLCLLGCLAACQRDQPPAATSTTAQTYVDELVNDMEKYSINRKTIDWTTFRQQVNTTLQGAQTIADTYPAIQLALTLLADNHSSYITASGITITGNRTIFCGDGIPAPVPANSRIGYVKVTGFTGSGTTATNFAQSIQNAIRQADSDSIRGWLIDLRGNLGGNLWPMLAGVGPILGEGIAGYFVTPDGATTPWSYQNGASIAGQTEQVRVTNPYTIRRPNGKVAVLTDRNTASSGEATAISFRNRPNTRSYGAPTCGLSTANSSKILSDNATFILTVGTLADRNKTLYGSQVIPDETYYSSTAVDKAVAWLLN